MIHATLSDRAAYATTPILQAALDYLAETDFSVLEEGSYAGPDRLFRVIVQRYQTRQPEQAVWESHRQNIDIQYVAEGRELFGYAPLANAPAVQTPYDADRDVIFYEAGLTKLPLQEGEFAVFFPHDVHAPGLAEGASTAVLKVVLKLQVGS